MDVGIEKMNQQELWRDFDKQFQTGVKVESPLQINFTSSTVEKSLGG